MLLDTDILVDIALDRRPFSGPASTFLTHPPDAYRSGTGRTSYIILLFAVVFRNMPLISVSETASFLGVSRRRVRQMLTQGSLDGQRIGRVWAVESDAVEHAKANRPRPGRPWTPETAWALLAVAGGRDHGLSPIQRSRARQRLESGLQRYVPQMGVRAERRRFYAHPSVIETLADEPNVVRSGISAAAHYELDVVAVDELEGYVTSSSLPDLINRFGLDEQAERPNVLLRVVDDGFWALGPDDTVAPSPVVAVDLLEASDSRSRRAGNQLAERL